jgi:hypothetical protein
MLELSYCTVRAKDNEYLVSEKIIISVVLIHVMARQLKILSPVVCSCCPFISKTDGYIMRSVAL